MAITLPTSKVPAATQDPKYLILFGLPKVGKTTILSTLENNLILDFENGSDFISALKVKINSIKDLNEVCAAIKEAKFPYKYITIDTITAVEELAKPLAIKLYRDSPMFSDRYGNVTEPASLPNGSGYSFWRTAIEMIIDKIAACAPNLIICGHVKDAALAENANGSLKTLDLTGKVSRILAAKSDAIGFVHRDENSNLCIQFGTEGEVLTGARPRHLANKDIIVAEMQEDGTFVPHWDRIYPSLAE